MRKRIIALLLALILTVGLLPTVALAAGETPAAGTSSDVKNGYYEGTTWKEGTLNQGTLPTGVETVSKTAKPTTNANEYEVTLQVVLKQTEENSGKAATVLVLDTSGSMAYCAECGAEPEEDCEHNYVKFDDTPNSSTKYYYKTTDKNGREKFDRAYYCDGNHTKQNHNAGWFNSSKNRKHTDDNRLADNNIYVETTRTSRLDAAKVAAENFLKTYSGLTFKTDGTPANNQNNRNLVAVYRRTYTAGDSYNTVFENETKWSDPIPANITPVTFYNTIDTGKDDYYPIIIPTIINKDTGMLNKTDHFAYVIGYPDGTVHPNGQITRAEVATIFFRLLRDEVRDGAFTTSNTYSDVAYGKWYNNPISTMSALGIITGYPDGTFKPNKPITRAEFAAIAARFDETQSGKSATFSDVIGHWAAKEIGIAYYNDWIKGYPDGTFKPDQNITRAEAMTLINRVLERKPESPADLLTNMNKWTDNMDTSKWYYLDVQEATNSHGYTRKTFNYELWRQMLPDPDWSRYER